MPPELPLEMSKSEYARYRGVSAPAISKAIRLKKIVALPNGKINRAAADFALGATQERAVARETREADQEAGRNVLGDTGLTKARTAGAMYDAQLKQLQYRKAVGQLVETAAVAGAAASCNEVLVRSLERMSARADEVTAAALKDGVSGVRLALKDIARDVRRAASDAFSKLATDALATASAGAEVQTEEAA